MTAVYGTNTVSNNDNNNVMTNKVNNQLGKDEFLKLLTAQLKNQDPMSPMENADFVAQLAQFSSLEQMSNVASSINDLKQSMTSLFSQSLLTQGASMIGKEAVGVDEQGNEISGVIESVRWTDGGLKLIIADKLLSMEQITEVRERTSEAVREEEAAQQPAEGETEASGQGPVEDIKGTEPSPDESTTL